MEVATAIHPAHRRTISKEVFRDIKTKLPTAIWSDDSQADGQVLRRELFFTDTEGGGALLPKYAKQPWFSIESMEWVDSGVLGP